MKENDAARVATTPDSINSLATPASPRKEPPIWLILGLTGAGGCLGLIALGVLVAVLFVRSALDKCPPKDFPVYPGAQQTAFNYETSGAASSCSVDWESRAASTEVEGFYGQRLSGGAWQLVGRDPE